MSVLNTIIVTLKELPGLLPVIAIGATVIFLALWATTANYKSQWWVFAAAVVFMALACLIPHGYDLIQINLADHPTFELMMEGKQEDELWTFVQLRFIASIVGEVLGIYLYSKFS